VPEGIKMAERYNKGESVELITSLFNENGNRVSGASVYATIKKPDGTITQDYPFTEDPQFSGIYKLTLDPTILDLEGFYLIKISSESYEPQYTQILVKDFAEIKGLGAGIYKVTIKTIFVDNQAGIPDTFVNILTSDGEFVVNGRTDTSGQVIFNLNAGSYKVRATNLGIATFDETTISVSSDTTISIAGERIVISPPADAGLVRIYGNIRDLNLSLANIDKVQISFKIYPPGIPQFSKEVLIDTFEVFATIDKNTGNFYVDLAKGIRVRVVCREAELYKDFVTPLDKDIVPLKNLI